MNANQRERLTAAVHQEIVPQRLIEEIEASAQPYSDTAILCQAALIMENDTNADLRSENSGLSDRIENLKDDLEITLKTNRRRRHETIRDLLGLHLKCNINDLKGGFPDGR
jgi:FtsZ-binding cell division protein ZapB